MIRKLAAVILTVVVGMSVFAAVDKQDKAVDSYIMSLHEKQNGKNHKAKFDISKAEDKDIEKVGKLVEASKSYDKKYREIVSKNTAAGVVQNEVAGIVGKTYLIGYNGSDAGKKFIDTNTKAKNEKIVLSKIGDNDLTALGKTIAELIGLEKYKSVNTSKNIDIYTLIGYAYISSYNLMIDSMMDEKKDMKMDM